MAPGRDFHRVSSSKIERKQNESRWKAADPLIIRKLKYSGRNEASFISLRRNNSPNLANGISKGLNVTPVTILSFNGQKFVFNKIFEGIVERLQFSMRLLEYEEDWDDDGALPTNNAAYAQIISFLNGISKGIYEKFREVLQPPRIGLTKDGELTLHWINPKSTCVIIFERGRETYFYSKNIEANIGSGGPILMNGNFNMPLIEWLTMHHT